MKRIVTIQDISCVGKCSITVALPIISAMGVETAILPTAVLSTHTMFSGFTCKDIDDQILPIAEHWQKEGIEFDAFYTGYLASAQQIKKVMTLIDGLKKENNLVIVDPAMADNGKLYPAFDKTFPFEMAKLCAKADIILPNITEACLLTNTEYRSEYDEAFAKDIMKRLADMGAKKIVLTGADFNGKYGVMLFDSESDSYYFYNHKKIEASYHGTGDIFSSTFTASLMRDKSLEESIEIAAEYTAECIRITRQNRGDSWYGVDFELAIPFLLNKLGK